MDLHAFGTGRPNRDGYLFGHGAAWFAFAMTIGLMVFDYVDRQIIVSVFPYLKTEWGLSDRELGARVRSTGCSLLAIVQNLFGQALRPLISGALSDSIGLEPALAIIPVFSLFAAAALLLAARTYDQEKNFASEFTAARGGLAG